MTSSEQSTSSNPPITTGSRLGFTYGFKKKKKRMSLCYQETKLKRVLKKKKQKARKTHFPLQPVLKVSNKRILNLTLDKGI